MPNFFALIFIASMVYTISLESPFGVAITCAILAVLINHPIRVAFGIGAIWSVGVGIYHFGTSVFQASSPFAIASYQYVSTHVGSLAFATLGCWFVCQLTVTIVRSSDGKKIADSWRRAVGEARRRNTQADEARLHKMQQSQKPNFEETHDVKYEEGTEYHVDQLNEEIRSLKQTNERLKEAVKTAVAQRDHWKQRALVVERELATSGNAERDRDKRLDALRRLIAKELHPDQCAAQGIERVLRAELFKLIWPKVEELSRQGRGGDQP